MLGKRMSHALGFVTQYPGWHTWDNRSRCTRDAVRRLERRGLVETNRFGQFRLAQSEKPERGPHARFWWCQSCGCVNAWNWEDAERAAAILGREVSVSHGSCFDNICGACGANHVRHDSPILAECYTH